VRDTISALAGLGARDRVVMTAGLAGLGVCHLLTATGLSPARPAGRVVLAIGGIATCGVAAFPQPVAGNSPAHTAAATVAFTTLALWPVVAMRRGPAPLLVRRVSSVGAAAVMASLVGWFAAELGGGDRGLAERAAAGAEALWPLAVVWTSRRAVVRRNAGGKDAGAGTHHRLAHLRRGGELRR
jgi:hypothetical protein